MSLTAIAAALKELLQFFAYLKPPSMHENGHKDLAELAMQHNVRLHRWRWAISNWLTVVIVAFICSVALATGQTPLFVGYASKQEVGQLKEQVDRIEVRQLEDALVSMRQAQCKAIIEERNAAFYTRQLSQLKMDYKALMGVPWDQPDCKEISS